MNNIAKILLESNAVHLRTKEENYFTWTSGKRSPIYCDNRQLISHPASRSEVVDAFCNLIKEKFTEIDNIAGTATAGIPWAAWIADKLNLPMIYIRSKPKGHGLKSAIEGHFEKGEKTLVIEDLISTGKSSIEALTFARNDGLEVLQVLSIFNYGFTESKENFVKAEVGYESLCDLKTLLNYAKKTDLIKSEDVSSIENWTTNF